VDAIRLVEAGHAADPFEQERHEGEAVLPREVHKDLLEARAVRGVEAEGQLHPDHDDARPGCLRALDRLREVAANGFQRSAHETVGAGARPRSRAHPASFHPASIAARTGCVGIQRSAPVFVSPWS
jgi:hypothetical protein